MVEAGHVLAGDLAAHARGDRGEVLVEHPLRIRPDTVGVRVVGAPDDVVLADQRDDRIEILVLLIGDVALPTEIVARPQFEIEAFRPVCIFGVEAVEHIGQPGHSRLAEHEVEVGVFLAGPRSQ